MLFMDVVKIMPWLMSPRGRPSGKHSVSLLSLEPSDECWLLFWL